jgi:hypothetical protein
MTTITPLAPCMRRNSRSLQFRSVMALAAILAVAPTSLRADARVQGSAEGVRIETQNTSVEEVLAALGDAFEVRYRSSAKLTKQLTGTYEGSLQRVVARVLEGYDFVLRTNKGKIEITVLGVRNATPGAAVASSPSNPPKAASISPPAQPAASPSVTTERQAPSVPAPAPAASAVTTVAQEQVLPARAQAASSELTKFAEMRSAAPFPSGNGPVPELVPGPPVDPPMPGPEPVSSPEPIPGVMVVPPPGPPPPAPEPGSAPVPPFAPASGMPFAVTGSPSGGASPSRE